VEQGLSGVVLPPACFITLSWAGAVAGAVTGRQSGSVHTGCGPFMRTTWLRAGSRLPSGRVAAVPILLARAMPPDLHAHSGPGRPACICGNEDCLLICVAAGLRGRGRKLQEVQLTLVEWSSCLQY
jgi:hypothetical protein